MKENKIHCLKISGIRLLFIEWVLKYQFIKLRKRWRGQFEIISQIDAVTYRVRQVNSKAVKVFPVHVQRMKRYVVFKKKTKKQL
jgi:hypothetical protein